jgi:hypothetical protein
MPKKPAPKPSLSPKPQPLRPSPMVGQLRGLIGDTNVKDTD